MSTNYFSNNQQNTKNENYISFNKNKKESILILVSREIINHQIICCLNFRNIHSPKTSFFFGLNIRPNNLYFKIISYSNSVI